jgi:hypothetical protein
MEKELDVDELKKLEIYFLAVIRFTQLSLIFPFYFPAPQNENRARSMLHSLNAPAIFFIRANSSGRGKLLRATGGNASRKG